MVTDFIPGKYQLLARFLAWAALVALVACTSRANPTATLVPTPDIQPTMEAQVEETVVEHPFLSWLEAGKRPPAVVATPPPALAPAATTARIPPPTVVPSPTPIAVPTPTRAPVLIPIPTPIPTPTLVPTPTPVPTSTPTPTATPHPYIESQDGNILIIYDEVSVNQEERELDLKTAQHLRLELAKGLPYGKLILMQKFGADAPTVLAHPHIESQGGNILIIYDEVPVTQKEMELDLKTVQSFTRELAKVYGRLPYGKMILEKGKHESHNEYFTTVPVHSIPFGLCDTGNIRNRSCSTAIHELGHYFTGNLLRTDQLWFNEGLSIVAAHASSYGVIDLNASDIVANDEVVYARSPEVAAKDYYSKLKSKENIFKIRECTAGEINEDGEAVTITWDCIDWLSAHDIGYMFFYGLAKDYGITGFKIGEFVRVLVELAEDGRRIGTDDLRSAALEVSGKDIGPLIDLLEPGIMFNGYGIDGRDVDFIKRHPEYSADETSWLDQ